jgi:hypothetical protein
MQEEYKAKMCGCRMPAVDRLLAANGNLTRALKEPLRARPQTGPPKKVLFWRKLLE